MMMAAIFNHLWQSTLFAAAAGLLTMALRKNSARVRYWLRMAATRKSRDVTFACGAFRHALIIRHNRFSGVVR
jgi:hypothetical protein